MTGTLRPVASATIVVMVEDDPGWRMSWPAVLSMLIPRWGLRVQLRRAESGKVDGLVMLRQVFVSFCFAIVAVGVVLAVLYPGSTPPADPPTEVVIALLVVGALAHVFERTMEKPLDCEDDATLATSYRTRFFLRLAFSEAAALIGFVGFFLTYAWWPYPVGATITAIGFRRAAPTSARLARDQEILQSRGCGRSLLAALRQPASPTALTDPSSGG